ncbi:unnamed protein product [Prorocentrum cordatum]|uniref:Uncharacterized protein n=1 Tax=Prorocentrum cordatum TaxID=2364126 RepID=A0ABN9UN82_9DINO|nr:unnamed protein product [Polarella glacialis]
MTWVGPDRRGSATCCTSLSVCAGTRSSTFRIGAVLSVKWRARLTNNGGLVSSDASRVIFFVPVLILVGAVTTVGLLLQDSEAHLVQGLVGGSAALLALSAAANLFHLLSVLAHGSPRIDQGPAHGAPAGRGLGRRAGRRRVGLRPGGAPRRAAAGAVGGAGGGEDPDETKAEKAVESGPSWGALLVAGAYALAQTALSWHKESPAFQDVANAYLERQGTEGPAWDARSGLAVAAWLGVWVSSRGWRGCWRTAATPPTRGGGRARSAPRWSCWGRPR